MKSKKTLLILFLIPLLSFSAHKYYLSLTEIVFNKEKQSVEIIINVFIDDIETVLNKNNGINLNLNTPKELKKNDLYFKTYLQNNLRIKIDKEEKILKYLGKEYEGDLVYFYIEILNTSTLNTIDVTNKILVKDFPKQQNLIKIRKGDQHKSVLLTQEKNKSLLKF